VRSECPKQTHLCSAMFEPAFFFPLFVSFGAHVVKFL
jgi:hypothetical protein